MNRSDAGRLAEGRQDRERAGEKHREHPRRAGRRECGEAAEAADRDPGDDRAEREHQQGEAPVVGHKARLRCNAERNAQCGSRDRNHRTREHAVEQSVQHVRERGQRRPSDAPQVPVQREPRVDRDRRAEQRPARDGEQIPHCESPEHVADRRAPRDEARTDHELGSGDVLARVGRREVAGSEKMVFADGLAVELVERALRFAHGVTV